MRYVLLLALYAALAACSGGPGMRGPRDLEPTANPSAVIATELAFAREAQEKGQWTAFRTFAADDATMFVPEPVMAQDWLKKQTNPPQAVRWQPYQVWSSCDGSLAVTKGAWQRPDGTVGYFTTVWRRQRNDEYKWELDQGDQLAEPLPAPEMIAARVADCPPDRRAVGTATARSSDDGSLRYDWNVAEDLSSRHFEVSMRMDGTMQTVLTSDVRRAGR